MNKRYTTRRKITAIVSAVAMSGFLGACGGGAESEAPAGESETAAISYGGQTIVPDLVFRAKDWGEPYEVDIEQVRFPSGGEAFEALLSEEVNVSNGGSGRLITIAAQRPDAVSIIAKWQFGGSRYSILTAPGEPLGDPSDLKGKTVAVDNGSGAYTLFQVWLENNGLALDDVKVIQTKIGNIGAAIQSGSADVGIAWEPTASLLVEKDLAERFTTLEEAGQSPNFLLVNKDWAAENRDAVVKFLRASTDVATVIKEDPETAGEMAAEVNSSEGVEASPGALAEALRHIKMTPQIDDASIEELRGLAQEMVDLQRVDAVPDFESMVDESFLNEALGE